MLFGIDPQQNDARHRHPRSEDKVTEALILRKEEPGLSFRALHYLSVSGAGSDLCDVVNVVRCVTQTDD